MAKKKEDIKYSELTAQELQAKLQEGREKLFQLKFQNTTAPLKNPREIRTTRRNIARALTFLRQKGVSA
jgi:large subunit ribosomal protein L29